MSFLTADEILNVDDRTFEVVDVPEWGGKVRIRSLTGRERDRFEESTVDRKTGRPTFENVRARLVAECVVDEDGKLLFTSKFQVQMLGNKSSKALQRVFNACQEINALSDEDVEELIEGFDEADPEASTSD